MIEPEIVTRMEAVLDRLERLSEALSAQPSPGSHLSVKEVASQLGVSDRTIYELVSNSHLKASRIGSGRGAIRIAPADLKKYQNRNQFPTSRPVR